MQQHIIPRLSLAHFADEDGKVWTYDKASGRRWSAVPDETGTERHYYSVEREDGSMDTTLETHFSEIESCAAPVYEALARGQLPIGNDRITFGAFLGMMHTRSPLARRTALEIHKGVLEAHLRVAIEDPRALEAYAEELKMAGKPSIDPAKLANDFRNLSGLNLKLAKPLALSGIAHAGKIAKLFLAMNWAVVWPMRGYFITCDCPIFHATDPKTYHPIYGDGGFVNPTVEITFPINPNVMLLMHWRDGLGSRGEMSGEDVKRENRKRAFNAERQVYAHVAHDGVSRLVTKYRDQKPGIVFSGAGLEKGFASVSTPRRWRGK
jgi:hypothetical protein